MKHSLLLSTFLVLGTEIYAQTTKPEIITDRPDQTEASAIVPKGGLQVELGTSIENDVVENVKVKNYTYTTALIKYGVNENFELRLNTEFLGEKIRHSESNVTKVSGLSPLALGVK